MLNVKNKKFTLIKLLYKENSVKLAVGFLFEFNFNFNENDNFKYK